MGMVDLALSHLTNNLFITVIVLFQGSLQTFFNNPYNNHSMRYNMTKNYENPKTVDEALVQCHRMMCKLTHNAIRNNKADFSDAYQIAAIGLTRAFNDFDTKRSNAKFTTVAYKYIAQHLMDFYKRKEYTYMNSISGKIIDDSIVGTINSSAEASIGFSDTLKGMTTVEKIATVARAQGYTYAEIAEMLNKVQGNEYTLHQVRRMQMSAVERAAA